MSIPKSLHTVTVVSRVAHHLIEMHPANLKVERGVTRALGLLGYKVGDSDIEIVSRSIDATNKLIAAKK